MYATCLWCQRGLGRNEAIESFPVGRRLAFDAAKGRLWVVCPACERWNLVPLEERWEAIEACERGYRDTRTRVSTGEIGLAKLREGLTLVRIGAPLLPEFAAWRYGDQFGRRFRRTMVWTGLAMGAVGMLAYGQFGLGIGSMSLGNLINPAMQWYRRRKRAAVLEGPDARPVPVTMHAASMVRVAAESDPLQVAVPTARTAFDTWSSNLVDRHEDVFQARDRRARGLRVMGKLDPRDFAFFEGDAARRVLATLLPTINREGGSKGTVQDSVRLLDASPADARVGHLLRGRLSHTASLGHVDTARRLALEIALHEADERRWMEGELAELEQRWREAEALAAIADRLPAEPHPEPDPEPDR
jgi:hypothetical protein